MLLSLMLLMAEAEAAVPESLVDATVVVTQGSSLCAGAVIDSEGTVLTAYHCVTSGGRPRLERRDGLSTVGRVVSVDRQRDLAWIEAPALSGGPHLQVSRELPEQGDPVWACGHPMAADVPAGFFTGTLRFSVADGVVSAVGVDAVQVSVPLNPGNSGGPVVDSDSKIIGVVSRRLGGQGLGFAGRVDAPERARQMGPIGGSWGLEPILMSDAAGAKAMSVGMRLDVVFRDRVVLGGAPLFRLSSAETGTVPSAELTGGLRQRIGRGPWALRVDALGGVQALREVSAFAQGSVAPVVSGRLHVRGVGIDVGYVFADPAGLRVLVSFGVPGTLGVF